MFRQRFDRVGNFCLSPHFVQEDCFVGLELAPDNAVRSAGARPARAIRKRA
jgi:hypothetical protein